MITAADKDAIWKVPAAAWKPGTGQDGKAEGDKDVAEITGLMSQGRELAGRAAVDRPAGQAVPRRLVRLGRGELSLNGVPLHQPHLLPGRRAGVGAQPGRHVQLSRPAMSPASMTPSSRCQKPPGTSAGSWSASRRTPAATTPALVIAGGWPDGG